MKLVRRGVAAVATAALLVGGAALPAQADHTERHAKYDVEKGATWVAPSEHTLKKLDGAGVKVKAREGAELVNTHVGPAVKFPAVGGKVNFEKKKAVVFHEGLLKLVRKWDHKKAVLKLKDPKLRVRDKWGSIKFSVFDPHKKTYVEYRVFRVHVKDVKVKLRKHGKALLFAHPIALDLTRQGAFVFNHGLKLRKKHQLEPGPWGGAASFLVLKKR